MEDHRFNTNGPDGFEPVRIEQLELAGQLPVYAVISADGHQYHQLRLIVRLHTQPIGQVDLVVRDDFLEPAAYVPTVWAALGPAINAHLRNDSLPEVEGIPVEGLSHDTEPGCLQARMALLATAPLVSIIVCTRNRPAQLARCLTSLQALDYPAFEIIVVDNAPSSSATVDLIHTQFAAETRIRYVREDLAGLSRGRNAGTAHARGEIIAITDDDVLADPAWLANIVAGFRLGEKVACVTGMILPAELETPAQMMIEEFSGYSKGFKQRLFDMNSNRLPTPLYPYSPGLYGSGANISFKADILRRFGGFDPALGAGSLTCSGEELALFVELILQGYQIAYMPGALVFHFHHRQFSDLRRTIYGYGVGLAASLTSIMLAAPWRIAEIAWRVPYGLMYALSPNSPKNRNKGSTYPAELSRVELTGMLYGPFAYWRSRRRVDAEQRNPTATASS